MRHAPTPQERERLRTIDELRHRVHHMHGLVERLAAATAETDAHTSAVRRALSQLRLTFMNHGFAALAQIVGPMEVTARRVAAPAVKARPLREGVAALRLQLEAEHREILAAATRRFALEKE